MHLFAVVFIASASDVHASAVSLLKSRGTLSPEVFKKKQFKRLATFHTCLTLVGGLAGAVLGRPAHMERFGFFVGSLAGLWTSNHLLVNSKRVQRNLVYISPDQFWFSTTARLVRGLQEVSRGEWKSASLLGIYRDFIVYADGIEISYPDFLSSLRSWNESEEGLSLNHVEPQRVFFDFVIRAHSSAG